MIYLLIITEITKAEYTSAIDFLPMVRESLKTTSQEKKSID